MIGSLRRHPATEGASGSPTRAQRARRQISVVAVIVALTACGATAPSGSGAYRTSSSPSPPAVRTTPSIAADACDAGSLGELPAGATCSIDPDGDPATSLSAAFTVPAGGWEWLQGPFKDIETNARLQRATAFVAEIANLTRDACTGGAASPPVGPTVDDLATALADLPPFEVTSPPTDVVAYGYSGKHLQIRVPLEQPFVDGRFRDCVESTLRTWISPAMGFVFYGYTAPGDTEDYWILDVDGTRIAVIALTSVTATPELIAERQAILDSLVIEP